MREEVLGMRASERDRASWPRRRAEEGPGRRRTLIIDRLPPDRLIGLTASTRTLCRMLAGLGRVATEGAPDETGVRGRSRLSDPTTSNGRGKVRGRTAFQGEVTPTKGGSRHADRSRPRRSERPGQGAYAADLHNVGKRQVASEARRRAASK